MKLESLPDEVVASLEVRNAWRNQVAGSGAALEFLVSDLARWMPGSAVRVAFLDGDTALHADIAGATKQITDACNLELDFGLDATGEYRRWHEDDIAYAAEIRVAFNMGGYFSLVGTDSSDATIGSPGGSVGGRPNQRSLNLGGYITDRPEKWEGTVRHEFLHALAFHHSHQNMRGTCEQEFRWDDDPDYVPSRNAKGVFVPDPAGRRPGIYTFLAGPPNNWPRAKVDHNLRTEDDPAAVAGPFDTQSVMLYSFPAFFYKSNPSSCAPSGNGQDLSAGDRRGLQLLYPHTAEEVADLQERAGAALAALDGAGSAPESFEIAGGDYRDRTLELLHTLSGGGS
ncbi:hypothetical protein LFT45_11025 [Arthrobacter sp. FW305-BF8]|uniref:hypothetical protein n=1 Tax=Arthrobacter sp. FW305-BF8 TaxID=2879617 RepID=UPI001F3466E5|nr:hypothetical protein [Arthrobacter sp. FW305-BF8]UKA52308.1 hypothetical protein LFT45_11025 [Arthrobacter sp. FW305-BF8]